MGGKMAKAKNPWGSPDKDSNPFRAPSKNRPAPAAKKDHRFDSEDNPKRSFTKDRTAGDAIAKKLFGGGR
jgi:hypothetical protein